MKIAISLTCLLASTVAAFSLNSGKGVMTVPDDYLQEREKIFDEVSVTLSDNIEDNDLVHVLMETWLDDVLVLLVVKKDGSARLKDSAGRFVTPSRRHAKQRELCSAFFREAENATSTIKALHGPVPEKGCALFYYFTVNREYISGGNVEYLLKSDSGFSRLYRTARVCLAEVIKAEK